MSPKTVAIYVPTYEPNAEHLVQALTSIQAQTYTHFTVFIHDDASTVDVAAMVKPFLQDQRFSFERSTTRLGIGGNWNACIAHGGSEDYVQFLFQDDTWTPQYLETMVGILEREQTVGFVAAQHRYVVEGEKQFVDVQTPLFQFVSNERKNLLAPGLHYGQEFVRWWMEKGLHPNVVGEPSFVMLRRSLVDAVGPFHEQMVQMLDVEYWIRCALKQDLYMEQKELGTFRVHAKAASAEHFESGAGMFDRLRTFQSVLPSMPRELRIKAKRTMEQQLTGMIDRFFVRQKTVSSVARGGAGTLLRFCLAHPALVVRALWKYVFSGEEAKEA